MRYDAKNNAAKVFLPRLVRAGGAVITHCQGIAVTHRGGAVTGVEATALDPVHRTALGTVRVEAPRVCVAGSALGTPAVLQRSDLPGPAVGTTLRCHPALVAAGEFPTPVEAWKGIPQTVDVTEFLDFAHHTHRSWILPAFAHPVGTATLLPGLGTAHRELMAQYDRFAVLTSVLHDQTAGTVTARGDLELTVDYWPDEADRTELLFGLARCVELLFAAGATRVIVPTDPVWELGPSDSLAALEALPLAPGVLDISAVHPMGTVPMGDDPATAAIDATGQHHHVAGLWVADGSVFPTSIGVPPQLSIYAIGRHVGAAIAASA